MNLQLGLRLNTLSVSQIPDLFTFLKNILILRELLLVLLRHKK